MVGVRGNRSLQDEKLVAAIFSTSRPNALNSKSAPATPLANRSTSDLSEISSQTPGLDPATVDAELVEDEALKTVSTAISATVDSGELPKVYGAQQTNLIVDARPTVNAYAMQAVGMGTENMENYKGAQKEYFGIDNIHVMRKSLNDVVEALKDSDFANLPLNREQLAKSSWLKHIAGVLGGALIITRRIAIYHSHVLIHCSDGWDRTAQLSALAQLCLDPYYRTLDGFITLVEKDWLSFGHMFRHRSGHLNSEKWFEIENERIANNRASLNGSQTGSGSGNAFENALSKAQGFFKKNEGKESSESEDEFQQMDGPTGKRSSSATRSEKEDKFVTKVKELSPVFHQFLDATYQLLYQFPTRFEFNERFLRRLLYHLYSCQYGTFLFDNEKERLDWKAKEKTRSVWDYFLARRKEFINEKYESEIDDHVQGKERIILPKKEDVRWWAEVFGRTDEEMNGPPGPAMLPSEVDVPVVTGVAQSKEALAAGFASLGIGRGSSGPSRPRSPNTLKEDMEVEMQ